MRVSAVSYLNTWPLTWGLLYGPQQGQFDLRFDLPSGCAAALGAGEVEIGLVPSAELTPLGLDFVPDLGIATDSDVRSILLISRCPFSEIRTLAVDSSSRTSVALARILLRECYGCLPRISRRAPDLQKMLSVADAALIIGDPALRIDPDTVGLEILDLGAAWVKWSGLPMVFAVWAGESGVLTPEIAAAFRESYYWGRGRLEEMVTLAGRERGFAPELVREYLTRHIVYKLGSKHREGLQLFRRLAQDLELDSDL